ncbi:FtsX-like permease family protein [Roseateles cavernae]|uniref:FtsX-like permease family protein n=1 Tax=Roseateles cavernae TaxID=3153578 RepID=UPI0032E37DBA
MRALLLDALRGLRSRRAGVAVAVVGLGLALAACLLTGLVALGLSDPAPGIPEPERLVILDFKGNPPGMPSPWFTRSPVAFATLLRQRQLPLEVIARAGQNWLDTRVQGIMRPLVIQLIDPELAPLLGLQALHGDLDATLRRRDAIALTPAMVRQLWGELPPPQALGRSLDLEGRVMTVTAIVPEHDPRGPLWAHEALAGYESQANSMSEQDREAIFMMNGRVFVRLGPGVSAAQLGPWMREAFLASPGYQKLPPEWRTGREAAFFRGLPLLALPFEGEDNEMRWQALAGIGAASLLLLLMAALNLLSLQSAALLQRQRETALRRSLGAGGAQLLRLWATELGLLLLASGALALLLAWWMAPLLSGALGLDPRHPVADPIPLRALLGLSGVLALLLPLTLALPAWAALKRAPAPALQGRTASEGPWGRRLRQGLLALQLGGALLLLALTGVLGLQQRHLMEADRGYALENRLYLGLNVNPERLPDLQPLIAALDSHPAVRRWAFSSMRPARDLGPGTQELYVGAERRQQVLRVNTVSASFFATYGMGLLAGQVPKAPDEGETRVVLDAKAARALGFATPQAAIGALVEGGGDFMQAGGKPRRVVAVVGDVNLESAREPARPQAFVLSEAPQWDITVHGDDLAALQQALEQIWQRHGPKIRHTIERVDRQRAEAYELEERLTVTLAIVAGLAVVVAMLGAYALVADTLRRRRTEIVLRRLHGAGDAAIAAQVAGEFAWPLLIAALLGLPLAALLGGLYLGGFADRVASLPGLVLPLALAAAALLVVTGLAAARHLRLALRLRPVEALG